MDIKEREILFLFGEIKHFISCLFLRIFWGCNLNCVKACS